MKKSKCRLKILKKFSWRPDTVKNLLLRIRSHFQLFSIFDEGKPNYEVHSTYSKIMILFKNVDLCL
jgi:hypothetical protein